MGKKDKDKGSKPSIDNDEFGKPSEAPAGGDGWRFEDDSNIGKLFLITPLRVKDNARGFEDKIQEVIVADIVEINTKRPEKSEEHEGVWVWGGWTKGALRGFVGTQRVLARLEQSAEKSRSKKNPAWVLEDGTKKDAEAAKAYLASVDPFAQKGSKKSKDDDEKLSSKKDKGGKSKGEPEKSSKKAKKK